LKAKESLILFIQRDNKKLLFVQYIRSDVYNYAVLELKIWPSHYGNVLKLELVYKLRKMVYSAINVIIRVKLIAQSFV
jgi:hypothetical protein